jgi:alkylhydroperoxidase family enzyme
MAYIKTIPEADAEGRLKEIYDAAVQRAGKVYNILRIQSMNPATLHGSMALYQATTLAASPVPRALREMIATVVSRTNACHY